APGGLLERPGPRRRVRLAPVRQRPGGRRRRPDRVLLGGPAPVQLAEQRRIVRLPPDRRRIVGLAAGRRGVVRFAGGRRVVGLPAGRRRVVRLLPDWARVRGLPAGWRRVVTLAGRRRRVGGLAAVRRPYPGRRVHPRRLPAPAAVAPLRPAPVGAAGSLVRGGGGRPPGRPVGVRGGRRVPGRGIGGPGAGPGVPR